MEDTLMNSEAHARRMDLTQSILETLNKHLVKYKTEMASKEVIFIMAQIVGLYANILDAPDEVMGDLHHLIDSNRAVDTSKLNIINPLDYQ
jgi:hypothetical protein